MKRNADQNDFDDGIKKAKSDSKSNGSNEFRFVIEKKSQGLLIGKGGAKITHVRQESGVFASILKVESQSVPERILVLQGEVEQCALAWKLFGDVITESAQLLNPESTTTDVISVKVLCDQTQIGSVIGKGGATIRQTQTDTGAKVQICNDPLPGSTEKTVSVSGTTEVVQNGLLVVLAQLRDYPMRPGTNSIQFSPGNAPPASPYGAPFNSYGAPPPSDPYSQNPYSGGFAGGFGSFPAAPSSSAPKHTQKIVIPTVCAGGVIGKGGSRIREMQAQSGCTIRLADATTEMPTERVVTLEGSNEGIQVAIQMIRSAVEATAVVPQ